MLRFFISVLSAHLHSLSSYFTSPVNDHPFSWLWLDRNGLGSICYLHWICQSKSLLRFADDSFHWKICDNTSVVLLETACRHAFVYSALPKELISLLRVRTVAVLSFPAFSCPCASAVSISYKLSWICCPVFKQARQVQNHILTFHSSFLFPTQSILTHSAIEKKSSVVCIFSSFTYMWNS